MHSCIVIVRLSLHVKLTVRYLFDFFVCVVCSDIYRLGYSTSYRSYNPTAIEELYPLPLPTGCACTNIIYACWPS